MPEHVDIADGERHEPKGISTAPAGYIYIANGSGGGAWTVFPDLGARAGFFDYNDLATHSVPLNITGGAGWVYIPNDELGAFTSKTYAPAGVTDVWDASLNKFDWSELSLGDMIDIRVDMVVTTTGANQEVTVSLEMQTDSVPYDIPFVEIIEKSAGAHEITRYSGVYMGSTDTLTNRARFKIKSDGNATLQVNGWYCKVILGG